MKSELDRHDVKRGSRMKDQLKYIFIYLAIFNLGKKAFVNFNGFLIIYT